MGKERIEGRRMKGLVELLKINGGQSVSTIKGWLLPQEKVTHRSQSDLDWG